MIAQLNDLLDAELNSVFAFIGNSTPYLDRSHAGMRKQLAALVTASHRRAERLYRLIESRGGSPITRGMQMGEQHLAYLSIDFLLPKLVEAKRRDIERYREVLHSANGAAALAVREMIAEQTDELAALQKDLEL